MEFAEIAPTPLIKQMLGPEARCFKHGRLFAIVTRDEVTRWHLSISHRDRLPTWDELSIARRKLLPADTHFCVPHPPEKFWVNLHPFTLHLRELRDEQLVKMIEDDGIEARRMGVNKPS